ncbi:MAG: hypothetical protein JHC93_04835 [Parachlamydiales bacterium]|nr:hypothetical protein [Parachlamydiales bacterium]
MIFGLLTLIMAQAITMQSDNANYQGNCLNLEGNIVLDHPMGKIEADIASVISTDPFNHSREVKEIELKNNVSFKLKDGAHFVCETAHLLPQQQSASFFGNYPLVTYRDSHRDKKGRLMKFELQSPQIEVIFNSTTSAKQVSQSVEKLYTEQKAYLNYNQVFRATADHATYQRPETITLLSDNNPATIRYLDKDEIFAQEIAILTQQQILTFLQPNGKIASYEGLQQPLIFSCQKLVWHELTGQLRMMKQVELDHGTFGHFYNDEQLTLARHSKKNELSTLLATGFTTVCYPRNENDQTQLTCRRQLLLDHQKLTAFLTSPDNEQVVLTDFLGEIRSDEAIIHYTLQNGQYLPSLIQLMGNVQLINTQSLDVTTSKPVQRYALADRVDYFLNSDEITLNAKPGKRVMLYDKLNERYLSAKTIYISQDSKTHREVVRGEGNVRMLFQDEELAQFKNQFHF